MDQVISALSSYLQSPMLAAFAIYVALIGIAILRGAVTDTFGDMLGRILKFRAHRLGGDECLGLRDLYPRPVHRHAPQRPYYSRVGCNRRKYVASSSFDQLYGKAYVLGPANLAAIQLGRLRPIIAVLVFGWLRSS